MPRPKNGALSAKILAALAEKVADPERNGQKVQAAYTVHALARKIEESPSRVEAELRTLKRAGKVLVRVTQANDVLYKLPDKHHVSWAAQNGVHNPRRSAGERPKGGRKVHITGWF